MSITVMGVVNTIKIPTIMRTIFVALLSLCKVGLLEDFFSMGWPAAVRSGSAERPVLD